MVASSYETDEKERRPLSAWRGLLPCLLSWFFIATLLLFFSSPEFRELAPVLKWTLAPLGVLLLSHQIFTLFLLTHESIHGLLSPNPVINRLVGRYLCAFPIGVSLDMWKIKHLLHHQFLGTPLDLDQPLYRHLERGWRRYVYEFFTGKVSAKLLTYFTPINLTGGDAHRLVLEADQSRSSSVPTADFSTYVLFQVTLIVAAVVTGNLTVWILFWALPHLIVQFYLPVWSALQHSSVYLNADPDCRSRTVLGSPILMKILMPLNVQYHVEHHLDPAVPQYWLRALSRRSQHDDRFQPCYSDLMKELRSLGHPPPDGNGKALGGGYER